MYKRSPIQAPILTICLLLTLVPQLVSAHGALKIQITEITRQIAAVTNATPLTVAQLYLRRGECYRENRKWRRAALDYDRAAQLAPSLAAEAHLDHAKMLAAAGYLKAARAMYDQVIEAAGTEPSTLDSGVLSSAMSPETNANAAVIAQAHVGRARVFLGLGQRLAAISDFECGLKPLSSPEAADYLSLSQALTAVGRTDAALNYLDQGLKKFVALESSPSRSPEVEIAQTRSMRPNGPSRDAMLNAARNAADAYVALQSRAVDLEMGLTNYEAALGRIQTILPRVSRRESWLARRGEILEWAGQTNEAIVAFKAAFTALNALPRVFQAEPQMKRLRARIEASLRLQTNVGSSPPSAVSPVSTWVSQPGGSPIMAMETNTVTHSETSAPMLSLTTSSSANISVIAPAENLPRLTSTPVLQVAVSNAAPGNITVQFYGRKAVVPPRNDFSLVALPDTQYYTDSARGGRPEMYYAQTEWIITNRISANIAYVAHLGDIVDHGDNNGGNPPAEWCVATNAMYRVEDPIRTRLANGIAYGLAVGNHDQSPNGDAQGTTTYFNRYFGVPHFSGRDYYAGHYGTNNDNHFDFFSAGGMDFVVLYFEYDPDADPDVLAWGNDVLRTNANRRAIVVTHYAGSPSTPSTLSPQAKAIYNTLKTNANFFLMLGGHVNGEGSRSDTFNGHTVHTLISDYQFWTNGGDGFLRKLTFSPTNNQVAVQTYSPWTGQYTNGPASEWWFNYDMAQPHGAATAQPFTLIGVTNVASGGTGLRPALASIKWFGTAHDTAYEWFVTVTDSSNHITRSSVWKLSTATNTPPAVLNALVNVVGDAATNLTLTTRDTGGDPLRFQTNNWPTHGLVEHFDPTSGAFRYLPARGFRGLDRFAYCASNEAGSSTTATFNLNVTAPTDANRDGLPDNWEDFYGVKTPNADVDGDGFSNFQEYLAGTNPTNAASSFRITKVRHDLEGHVTLTWASVGGVRYRVQYARDGLAGSFTDIVRPMEVEMDSNADSTSSTQTFVDDFTTTGTPTNPARYYRIKIVQ